MDNGLVLDDELGCDIDVDLVSMYLLAQIRKRKPEWFAEFAEVGESHPPVKKKRKKKPKLKGKFNVITTKNNDSSWEDNLPDFVDFEKSTRVYQ